MYVRGNHCRESVRNADMPEIDGGTYHNLLGIRGIRRCLKMGDGSNRNPQG